MGIVGGIVIGTDAVEAGFVHQNEFA
ncbi:hypothetical protein [Peribacillus butanolivorans]